MKNLHPANLIEWLNWWHKSCEWNTNMVAQAHATASLVPSNYRYFIGTGSRHTMYGSNKVYTDNTSGTLIVDWVNQMLNRSGSWSNVECPDPVTCGTTLPGDPLPTTRVCEGGSNDGGAATTTPPVRAASAARIRSASRVQRRHQLSVIRSGVTDDAA
jgi:hypothetical protein